MPFFLFTPSDVTTCDVWPRLRWNFVMCDPTCGENFVVWPPDGVTTFFSSLHIAKVPHSQTCGNASNGNGSRIKDVGMVPVGMVPAGSRNHSFPFNIFFLESFRNRCSGISWNHQFWNRSRWNRSHMFGYAHPETNFWIVKWSERTMFLWFRDLLYVPPPKMNLWEKSKINRCCSEIFPVKLLINFLSIFQIDTFYFVWGFLWGVSKTSIFTTTMTTLNITFFKPFEVHVWKNRYPWWCEKLWVIWRDRSPLKLLLNVFSKYCHVKPFPFVQMHLTSWTTTTMSKSPQGFWKTLPRFGYCSIPL